MKKYILLLLLVLSSGSAYSIDLLDTIPAKWIKLNEVSVFSYKKTNHKKSPLSQTLLSQTDIEKFQVNNIKNLNGIVPNFYVPDYGSAMSSAIYVRGLGSRGSGQTVSLYVDNMPYMNKSAFDFEFYDISQIEILKGSQGTLYGRNSLAGIINIYTLSPLHYQGTKVAIKAGNFGQYKVNLSTYQKPTNNFGYSISGFYNHIDGMYKNQFTKQFTDPKTSSGLRLRADWLPLDNMKLEYVGSVDKVKQGAFPYGLKDKKTGEIASPNFNDLSDYDRTTFNNNFLVKYGYSHFIFSANLSHQYFADEMNMDQDFTPANMFQIHQNQKGNMFNGEFIMKDDVGFLVGANIYYENLNTSVPVSFKKDAINFLFNRNKKLSSMGIKVLNDVFRIPALYKNRTFGTSIFTQSTINNLFLQGFSLTYGFRFDAENMVLDYDTEASLDFDFKGKKMTMSDNLKGTAKQKHTQFTPKLALKYEYYPNNSLYLSASRGYKSGGFNITKISELMNQKLTNKMNPNAPKIDVEKQSKYDPETAWDFELGANNLLFDYGLTTSLVLYYMDVRGLQLTQFLPSGTGRILTNAGRVVSKGLETSLNYQITGNMKIGLSYGLSLAQFKNYKQVKKVKAKFVEVDYKGKYVPYAPQNSVGVNLQYHKCFINKFIDGFYANINYNGVGKIYWNEENSLSENYYQLVNTLVGVKKGNISLEFWAKNLFGENYNTFYFNSFGNDFLQKGKKREVGATLKYKF